MGGEGGVGGGEEARFRCSACGGVGHTVRFVLLLLLLFLLFFFLFFFLFFCIYDFFNQKQKQKMSKDELQTWWCPRRERREGGRGERRGSSGRVGRRVGGCTTGD